LFLGHGTHIKGLDGRAHVLGRLNRRQTSDTRTNHEHLGGWHLTGGRHLPRHEAPKFVRGLQNGAVAANIGLARERVVGLAAAEGPGNAIHGKGRGLVALQLRHQGLILSGPQHGNERLVAEGRYFLGCRGTELRNTNMGDMLMEVAQ
jgi:hypothetical protein